MKFDEYDFKYWLDRKVGFSIRKAEGKVENPNYDRADIEVQNAVDNISAMELVCYLGEYLSE